MAAYDQVLELRLGAPRWYPCAVWLAFAFVVLNLLLTPLQWPYLFLLFLIAGLAVGFDFYQRSKQKHFLALRIYPNRTAVLLLANKMELAVELGGMFWLSRLLIVARIDTESAGKQYLLISRQRNSRDNFRRFSVLSRFAFAEPRR